MKEKKTNFYYVVFLLMVLLCHTEQAKAIGSATFYYKVSYSMTGKGTVYVNGPLLVDGSNTSHDFDKVTTDGQTKTVTFSKGDYGWFSKPNSTTMYYTLYAENTDDDYQFDHWEKKNGSNWDIIEGQNSRQYQPPTVTVRETNTNPAVSATFRGVFKLKGVLKVEVEEGQEDIGQVYNSKVANEPGDVVTLTASSTGSFQGVTFSHWTIDGNSEWSSTINPLTVTVPEQSIVYRAHFTKPDGFSYCVFENVATGRLLSLASKDATTINSENASDGTTNYKALIINALKQIDASTGKSNAATVFYLGGTSDGHEGLSSTDVFMAQGEDVKAISLNSYVLKITKEGSNYRISTTMTVNSNGSKGDVFLRDENKATYGDAATPVFAPEQDQNSLWKIHFLDDDHAAEYMFGVAPNEKMLLKGKYYSTLYTSFPYKMLDGVKAYYMDVNRPDEIYDSKTKKITLLGVDGNVVPARMAVVLECSSTDVTNNRLMPLVDVDNQIQDILTDRNNLLKGVLKVGETFTGAQAAEKYKLNQDYVYVFSSKNDKVSFYKWSGDKALPNNKCYLAVTKDFEGGESDDGNAAKDFTFVFGNDNEEEISGIDKAVSESPAESETIFDLQGRKVVNPNAGIYIKNNKKIVIK